MRGHAANWLELAEKVYHFRRDVLSPTDVADLQAKSAQLRTSLKERSDVSKLKLGIEALEETLRRTGGKIYPKSSFVENIEFLLVAAIVILGIRTYFIQPFKIPTNSMWPSYFGMTPQVYPTPKDEPSKPMQAARFLLLGASSRRIDAPADGEVLLPVGGGQGRSVFYNRIVSGRTWLVLPTKLREYVILVDGVPVTFRVPLDFDFDWTVHDAFFPDQPSLGVAVEKAIRARQAEVRTVMIDGRAETLRVIRTGKRVRKGERVLSFDVLTGDQLVVDRMSYHFVRPSVGSGFVFRTGNIPGLSSDYGDQYYIKRLVGTPGDRIEIRSGVSSTSDNAGGNRSTSDASTVLMRNGRPIDEHAGAFRKNNEREGLYGGYQPGGILELGQVATIPDGKFLALGDNSRNSLDGRSWGFVPGKDVVGRPLWIYYPFTNRWGPAK